MARHQLMMKLCKHIIYAALLTMPAVSMISCQKTQTASAEQIATKYGEAADGTQKAADSATAAADSATQDVAEATQGGRNRFGFGGNESDAPVKPLRRDTSSHKPEAPKIKEKINEVKKSVADVPKVEKKIKAPTPPSAPPAPKPKPPSTDPIVRLGYAENVSSDKLHVTLPGEYAKLGQISVERMDPAGNSLGSPWSRGTQMQIPNPNVPGGKIYFKVP